MSTGLSGIGTATGAQGAVSATGTASPRLVHATNEFESQMMQELLKPLTRGMEGDSDDSEGALEGSMDSLASFGAEALGTALARSGGFGIATGIIRELSHNGNQAKAEGVTKVGNQKANLNTLREL
ncbi:MAG: hypothetical protein KGN79_01995 [Acidobacteriota bacterium]|nr:hypothetical protein [Acidobacteriota bacterium]